MVAVKLSTRTFKAPASNDFVYDIHPWRVRFRHRGFRDAVMHLNYGHLRESLSDVHPEMRRTAGIPGIPRAFASGVRVRRSERRGLMSQSPTRRSPDADHESEGAVQASRDAGSAISERDPTSQARDLTSPDRDVIRDLGDVIWVLGPWINNLSPANHDLRLASG